MAINRLQCQAPAGEEPAMYFLLESFSLNASQLGSKDTLSATQTSRPISNCSKGIFDSTYRPVSVAIEQATSSS